jgi:H+/Cl- antiporter ClcA
MEENMANGFFGLTMIISLLFSVLCYCIPIIIGIGFFAIWIWMLVDLLQRDEKDLGPGANNKVIWLLVLLLTNGIGAIVYYFMIYNKFKKSKI